MRDNATIRPVFGAREREQHRREAFAWDALLGLVEGGDVPAWVDWSSVTVCGVPVPALTTALRFPGHEPDLFRDIIPERLREAGL